MAILPVISTLSAILSGLSTFLNLAERADKHRLAGVRYKAMIREFERRLSEGAGNSTIIPSVLNEMQKRLNELEEGASIVPERIFILLDKVWNHRGVNPVAKADNL